MLDTLRQLDYYCAMDKHKAKKLLGLKSDYALAMRLGVTRQAVSQWQNDMPPERVKQVMRISAPQQRRNNEPD